MKMETYNNVDNYIGSFPKNTQKELEKLRTLIKGLAPEAIESISYGMPGYKLNKKPLVYFAAWRDHISFYPTPNGMEAYKNDLLPYKTGNGTAQFPLDKPLPYGLIEKIVKFRIEEVLSKK